MASGDTLLEWFPANGEPPATVYATFITRNGILVAEFDDSAATEGLIFRGVLPNHYGGSGLTLEIHWMGKTATTGNVVWGGEIERGNTDLDSDSFATQQTATGAANGTSGIETVTNITFSNGANMDSLAAGEAFRLRVSRLGSNGSDTMTGDAQLISLHLKET
jgi:hypothetical protein